MPTLLAFVRLGTALLTVAAGVPAAAQFDTFNWQLQGLQGGFAGYDADHMFLSAGRSDPAGTFFSFTTTAPVAGRVTAKLDHHAFDGVCACLSVAIVGDSTIPITSCSGTRTVVFDVPAGETFGFGMQVNSPTWPADAAYSFFEFSPAPVVVTGSHPGDAFGSAVAGVGDVSGDGVPDVVVGAPQEDSNGIDAGTARVLSGATGATLFTFVGDLPRDFLGASVAAAGDVNADGVPDIIVGMPGPALPLATLTKARVYSGADGTTLFTLTGSGAGDHFGAAVAGVGDLNGDGFADVAVGAPDADVAAVNAGRVSLFAGVDGGLLRHIDGGVAGAHLGVSVAPAGDVDDNGSPDILVGAPGDVFGGIAGGSAYVFSAGDGSVLLAVHGDIFHGGLGQSVAGVGDVNGDGRPDVAVCAPVKDFNGAVLVISGADGSLLYEIADELFFGELFGIGLCAAGDVDGDGVGDIVAGTSQPNPPLGAGAKAGYLGVYSGSTGALLHVLMGAADFDLFGQSVASAGDVDGDGLPELVVGAPGVDGGGNGAGVAEIRGFFTAWFELGQGLAGSHGVPLLKGKGLLLATTPFALTLSGALENVPSTLVVGLAPLGAAFKGGVLVPTPDVLISGLSTGAGSGFTLGVAWPAGVPSGLSFYLQAWLPDPEGPAGFAASNALRARTP
jgi:hypothetical protein